MPPSASVVTDQDMIRRVAQAFQAHASGEPFTKDAAVALNKSFGPCPLAAAHEANGLPAPRDARSGYPVRVIAGMVISLDPENDANLHNPRLDRAKYVPASYVPKG